MQALTTEQIKELRTMIDCLPVDGVKRRGLMVSRFNASGTAHLRDICHCGLGYGQPDESEKYAALIASMLSNALALIDAAERAEKYEKALRTVKLMLPHLDSIQGRALAWGTKMLPTPSAIVEVIDSALSNPPAQGETQP